MLSYVSDYRVILFILGLLPSVIVNLSTNYQHHSLDNHKTDEPITDLSRILPGDGNKESQVESPLQNHRQKEETSNEMASPTMMDTEHRYQLIGVSQQNGLHEDFITKPTKTDQSNKKGTDLRWIKKMYGKSSKKRKVTDQDFLPKKLTMGYEEKDQLLMDDNYRDLSKKPLHDNKPTLDGLRSGYYYDSYGDWHHNGGGAGDHPSTSGTWTNGLTDIGGGYFGGGAGISSGHSQGSGFHLAGWHLLNPLILVATLSFVISLINALLGLADKVKLSLARGRRTGQPEYSRVDEEFLDELGKLYDSIQYRHNHV